MDKNTYVISVNGKIGDLPYEMDRVTDLLNGEDDYKPEFGLVAHHHRNLVLDAGDIWTSGESGDTIPQTIQYIYGIMRPLIMEQIGNTDDYVMHVESGIPYEPVN